MSETLGTQDTYRAFFEYAPDAVLVVESTGRIVDANTRAVELFGYRVDTLIGMVIEDLVPEEARPVHAGLRAGYVDRPRARAMGEGRTLSALRADGTQVPVDISLSPVPSADGVPIVVAAVRDVTAHRAVLAALEESEARFRSVFDASPVGMAIVDSACRFIAANPTLCDLLGYTHEELAELSFDDVTPPEDVRRDFALAAEVFAGARDSFVLEKRYLAADGHTLWAEVRVARLPGSDEARLVLMATDVTERKYVEADLAHRALHDELTGLANRALAIERLEQALARAGRTRDRVGVLFADLDHFKQVNDRLGHAAGDEVLRATADRISAMVRPYDTVARFGGDEFVVISDAVDADEAEHLLSDLARRIRDAVSAPITIGGEDVVLTLSVGVATGQGDATATHLLARADNALYAAKSAGRDREVLAD